jgi:hypothetical protein
MYLRGGKRALLATVSLAGVFASSAHAAGPPEVGPIWSSNVSASAALLSAEINPEGQRTSFLFQYLPATSYEANIAAGRDGFSAAIVATTPGKDSVGAGSTNTVAKQEVSPLTPQTPYVYRVIATNAAAPGGVASPPRAFSTQQLGSPFALPDHRGWELVSPLDKNGGEIQGFNADHGGGVIQASADGLAFTYSSNASFGEAAAGAPTASQYLSARGGTGWATHNISVAGVSGSYGDEPDGVPYQLFSPNLARALMLNGSPCAGSESCPRSYALLEPPGSAATVSPAAPDLHFAGASPNLEHVVLSSCAALTTDAVEEPGGVGGCDRADTNLYEWSGGGPTLVNDPAGETPPSFGHLAARGGAVSEDGSRVYWDEVGTGDLWNYEAGRGARRVPSGAAAVFQTASTDGSSAFFTVGDDLYRYDVASGTSPLLATEVTGVLGASADGHVAYFQTEAGLFRWAEGARVEIAAGPNAAQSSDFPPSTGTARVSADGDDLAFLSAVSLTGYDNVGPGKAPVPEVYLYDADSGRLTCASCNPTGERPLAGSSIPGAVSNGFQEGATDAYKPRVLSTTGPRLFFDSGDTLTPQDVNTAQDVYEWEAGGVGDCAVANGCVRLISSGPDGAGASFLDASGDGSDVFFLTSQSLVGPDPGSFDVYDAREGGGGPEPQPPFECEGDSCQALPSEPEDPAVGTDSTQSPGNPSLHFAPAKKVKHPGGRRGKRHRHRKHHHRGHRDRPRKQGKA